MNPAVQAAVLRIRSSRLGTLEETFQKAKEEADAAADAQTDAEDALQKAVDRAEKTAEDKERAETALEVAKARNQEDLELLRTEFKVEDPEKLVEAWASLLDEARPEAQRETRSRPRPEEVQVPPTDITVFDPETNFVWPFFKFIQYAAGRSVGGVVSSTLLGDFIVDRKYGIKTSGQPTSVTGLFGVYLTTCEKAGILHRAASDVVKDVFKGEGRKGTLYVFDPKVCITDNPDGNARRKVDRSLYLFMTREDWIAAKERKASKERERKDALRKAQSEPPASPPKETGGSNPDDPQSEPPASPPKEGEGSDLDDFDLDQVLRDATDAEVQSIHRTVQ